MDRRVAGYESGMSNADEDEPVTDAASGGETLLDVLAEAESHGYGTQHVARDDGGVECLGCGETSDAERFTVDDVSRLEGASDAADLMLVARTVCPACGCKGVLTLGYGPNASDEDTAVLDRLDISPADAT